MLKRDYSAQTELNQNVFLGSPPNINRQIIVQQTTSKSDSSEVSEQEDNSKSQLHQPSNFLKVTNDFRSSKIPERLLTSYDEIFYSHLHDDSNLI